MDKRRAKQTGAKTPEAVFAAVLKKLRHERGVSQEDLGYDSGYHRTYISMLERGMMNPSLRTILSLAAALKVSASDLVARVEAHLAKNPPSS